MKETRITESQEDLILILSDHDKYKCRHDPMTQDWIVTSDDDEMVQGNWMMSKEDAILYVLYRVGLLDNPKHERAPDRTGN